MPIRSYLDDHSVFEPEAIEAMSKALEETCKALHINGQAQDREPSQHASSTSREMAS